MFSAPAEASVKFFKRLLGLDKAPDGPGATRSAQRAQSQGGGVALAEPPAAPARRAEAAPFTGPVAAKVEWERDGWFGPAELDAYAALEEMESEEAEGLLAAAPFASREEVLFRYRLSRAVHESEYELPLLPTSALQVVALSRRPDAEVRDYAGVIERDPALVRAVLKLATSAYYQGLEDISDLRQAIVRIGLGPVEQIALASALRSRVFKVRGCDDLVDLIVAHGCAAGIASRHAAALVGANGGMAYLSGLFHDVGKLVLLKLVQDVQGALRWQAPRDLVLSAFASFHEVVGRAAAYRWELPAPIGDAIGAHEDAEEALVSELGQAVYLGNLIAHALGRGDASKVGDWQSDPVVRGAGIEIDALARALREAREEIEIFESALAGY